MESDSVTQADSGDTKTPARRPRSRAHRVGLWSLVGVSLATIAAGILVLLIIGQTMQAPLWLRDRIERRIEQNLNGLEIDFGEVELVIRKGWRPRLRLRDVVLSDVDGQIIVQLADAEASLAMRPLLRGAVQPKRISLTGAFATLRRDADGKFSLALGNRPAPVRRAASLPQLIKEGDRILMSPQLAALASFDLEALTLRYEDAMHGQAWTLDGGRIRIDRNGDSVSVASSINLLSGGDTASFVEASYSSRIGETSAEFGISVRDIDARPIAAQSVGLAWLDVLRAPISGSLRGSVDSDGRLGALSATLQIGAGVLQPTDQTRPIAFSGAQTYFTYDPGARVLVFDTVSVSSDWGTGSAEGRAYLGAVEAGRLTELIGQFTFTDLGINPDDLYPEPLRFSGAVADFRLELAPFRLTLGQMHISDPQSQVQLSGFFAAEADGWNLGVDARMDRLDSDRLVQLWPHKVAPKPRKWVTENLTRAQLSDLDLSLRIEPGRKPDIYADFEFSDATIRFMKTMPPIVGGVGQGSLLDNRFVVTAAAGAIKADQGGMIDVAGTSFIIPDIGVKKAAPGVVRIVGKGAVTAILSLLNRPPLQILKDTPLPVDLAEGNFAVTGSMALPLKDHLQFPEVTFHFDGEILGVKSTVLVPGQTMSAPALHVEGDQTGIAISGVGTIGTVPADVTWRQPLGKGVGKSSRVDGTVELSQRLIDTFGIALPPGSVSGTGQGSFSLGLGAGGPPALSLKSDLRGVGLRIPQLGWAKPENTTGLFELAGTLGAKSRIDRLVLDAAGLKATGTVLNSPGGGMERAMLSSVRLGGWLDASVELVGRAGRASPDIRILGGTLDMRKASFTSSGTGSGSDSGVLDVTLGRLQISDTIALTDFSGKFTTAGGMQGSFTGRVNGETEVIGRMVPKDGRSAIRIQSQDAGGVIRSAGLLTQGRGGAFDLSLVPVGEPGQFDGTLRMTDTRVTDAPAIAALLNSISVVGLIDEMAGNGIQFTEVDARFRLGPSRVTVYSSSAVGPSIGLSMDGTMDLLTKNLNMRGVISPIYMLNSIGSLLTRKGEGVIGFNYTLTGPASSPRVQVNPLSALAPGMFREIFRDAPRPEDGSAPPPPSRPANSGVQSSAGER